jgi:hypothetical protein
LPLPHAHQHVRTAPLRVLLALSLTLQPASNLEEVGGPQPMVGGQYLLVVRRAFLALSCIGTVGWRCIDGVGAGVMVVVLEVFERIHPSKSSPKKCSAGITEANSAFSRSGPTLDTLPSHQHLPTAAQGT